MVETISPNEPRHASYRDYGGRIHSYGTIGVLLMLMLVAGVLLAYYRVEGPKVFQLDVALWVLALLVFFMALCLLYVLFTLRGALRLVRQQATEVAVMRALAHRHEIVEPLRSQPSIEYNTTPSSVHVQQTPTYVEPLPQSRGVEAIEGIGPVYRRRLARAGIENLRDVRAATGTQIADAAQAPRSLVDRWKAMADLMVVREVDPQAAEILAACNVHSVEELGAQDVDTLTKKCQTANAGGENRIVPYEITREEVDKWVRAARSYGADGSTGTLSRGNAQGLSESAA